MSFEDWSTQQSRQGAAQRAAQAERHARDLVEAERVIAALEEQLRSVVPHLAAFPRVSVGEQRVDINSVAGTASVVGIGPATDAWEFPSTAYSQPRYWVDVRGRLWHEGYAHITFRRPTQPTVRQQLDSTASAALALPFTAGMVRQQWQAKNTRGISMEATVDGQRLAPGSTPANVGVELTERRLMDFFDTESSSAWPAVIFDGKQGVGWANYDSSPTMVRDDVFRRVRAALDRGAVTL